MNQEQNTIESKRQKSLAMAYIPWQHFSRSYEPQQALMRGTIFPELDKPFTGRNGGRRR